MKPVVDTRNDVVDRKTDVAAKDQLLNLDVQSIKLESNIYSTIEDGVTASGCCGPHQIATRG